MGKVSDRIGRKPMLLLATFCSFLPTFSLWYTTDMRIYALALIIGAPQNACLAISYAYIADLTKSHERDLAFAMSTVR